MLEAAAPAPCKLTNLLTLKVVSESHVTWATSVPILIFLGLSVLDLGLMCATDRRHQTRIIALMPPLYGGRGIIMSSRCVVRGNTLLVVWLDFNHSDWAISDDDITVVINSAGTALLLEDDCRWYSCSSQCVIGQHWAAVLLCCIPCKLHTSCAAQLPKRCV